VAATQKTPLAEVKEFGRIVGETDSAYVRLAIKLCTHAAKGRIDAKDTEKFLVAFNDARRKARGEARLVIPPGRQQVAKLRRVLVAGETFGPAGAEMLMRAAKIYVGKIARSPDRRVSGEYNAVVEVARAAVKRGDVMSDREITKLLIK
jgi:hypothetical protein